MARAGTTEPATAGSAALVVTLGGLSAVAPLGIDMYVAGLPGIAAELGTGVAAVQSSVTAFLLGIVAGQVLFGPLGDRFGRRVPLLGGTALSAVFALVCAAAPNIEVFATARFLAGFFGAVGAVLGRAVITDLYRGPRMARYFTALALITGVAPVAAPAVGGLVLQFASWRYIFVLLALISVGLTLCVLRWVPETLPAERRTTGGFAASFSGMAKLARDRRFAGHVLVLTFAAAALFAYVSDSSFVFESFYGVGTGLYTVIFASNACAMLLSSITFGALASRVAPAVMLRIGVGISLLGTFAHVAGLTLGAPSLALSWASFLVTLAGLGLVFPATTTIAQSLGRAQPGAASALLGGGQFALGAVISPLAGVFATHGATPLALVMAAALACSGLVLLTFVRREPTTV